MKDEESVEVEKTTRESQPEENPEEAEAPEEQSEGSSSEETLNTAKEESGKPEPKRSRASERIRELNAQKKALEARLQQQQIQEPQLEGVDETGIDPQRYAESVKEQARREALNAVQLSQEFNQAFQQFPVVKENNLVRARAAELFDEGYTPVQAAEIASLEFEETQTALSQKSTTRQVAKQKSREGTYIPSAGRPVREDSEFTEEEISKMSIDEYERNKDAIFKQYGIRN